MAGYTANRDGAKLPARFANDDTVVYDPPSQSLHDRGSKRFYYGQGLMIRAPIIFFVSFSNLPLDYPSAFFYGLAIDSMAKLESQLTVDSAGTRLVLSTTW